MTDSVLAMESVSVKEVDAAQEVSKTESSQETGFAEISTVVAQPDSTDVHMAEVVNGKPASTDCGVGDKEVPPDMQAVKTPEDSTVAPITKPVPSSEELVDKTASVISTTDATVDKVSPSDLATDDAMVCATVVENSEECSTTAKSVTTEKVADELMIDAEAPVESDVNSAVIEAMEDAAATFVSEVATAHPPVVHDVVSAVDTVSDVGDMETASSPGKRSTPPTVVEEPEAKRGRTADSALLSEGASVKENVTPSTNGTPQEVILLEDEQASKKDESGKQSSDLLNLTAADGDIPTSYKTPGNKPNATREYLDATVVPIMLAAMNALVSRKPEDPIEFVIAYMQKNKPAAVEKAKALNEQNN